MHLDLYEMYITDVSITEKSVRITRMLAYANNTLR